jgi:hypothetical protein
LRNRSPWPHLWSPPQRSAKNRFKCPLTIAKLLIANDLDDFAFGGTPIDETLVNGLARAQRNAMLVGADLVRAKMYSGI